MTPALQKTASWISVAYHFDIYQFSEKIPARFKRFFIFLSLFIPPIAILVAFLHKVPDLQNFTLSMTTFSKSPLVTVTGETSLLMLLAAIVILQIVMLSILAPLDLWVRSRNEQKPVAWEDCFVFSIASGLIGLGGFLAIETPIVGWLVGIASYLFGALDAIEPIASVPFFVVALFVYVLDDVFFYIGHRLAHNVRVIWKLGHMQHHRTTNLTSATSCADYGLFFLNGGGGSFVTAIIGKAVFFKLLADVNAATALSGAFLIASLNVINHTVSHSYSAYMLFSKYKALAFLERFFVTGRIHYVHHSKLREHNISSGCNFAAQFVWLDKLMGTWAAPSQQVPPTGLFHEVQAPGNPIKYALDQWIKFGRELYRNSPRYWPKIFFADPSYEPPNRA